MKNTVLRTLLVMIIAFTVCVFAVGCGCGGEDTPGSDTPQNQTDNGGGRETADNALSLNLSYIVLEVGENATLIAFNYEGSVEWTSSNPSVCEVNGGNLNAKAEGGAIITAKSGGSSVTCRVVVQNSGVVAAIELENPEVSILLGGSLNLGAKVTFKGKTVNAVLTYKSENTAVATIDANGCVTGVSEGVTYVNVYDNTRGLTETVKVTVRNY